MSTVVEQKPLRLAFGVHHAPVPAPAKVLRQVEDEAQALRVSIKAGGRKQSYVAAYVSRSESYISLLASGKRPIPERLVRPLCAATGSLLLEQFRDLQAALNETCQRREVERLAALLREAA